MMPNDMDYDEDEYEATPRWRRWQPVLRARFALIRWRQYLRTFLVYWWCDDCQQFRRIAMMRRVTWARPWTSLQCVDCWTKDAMKHDRVAFQFLFAAVRTAALHVGLCAEVAVNVGGPDSVLAKYCQSARMELLALHRAGVELFQ